MRRTSYQTTYVIIGISFVLFMAGHYSGWLRPVENALQALLSAPFSRLHGLSVQAGASYEFFSNEQEFINRYRQCQEEQSSNAALQAREKLLREENAELKKQLRFTSAGNWRTIGAQVIGNALGSAGQRTFIISQGSASGVPIGAPVIVGNGLLIGKIIKTEPHLAFVRLLSDNSSRVGARVLNGDRSIGIVEGGYGIGLRMNFIPRNEAVHVGDQVVTSGLEDGMPLGLLIGSIVVVENESYQPFQQAAITPATDLAKLTMVSVILNLPGA